jgi:hypothetical protein
VVFGCLGFGLCAGALVSSSHEPQFSNLTGRQFGGPFGMVWGLMAGLQGTASHESGMFVWGLALEVEAPG